MPKGSRYDYSELRDRVYGINVDMVPGKLAMLGERIRQRLGANLVYVELYETWFSINRGRVKSPILRRRAHARLTFRGRGDNFDYTFKIRAGYYDLADRWETQTWTDKRIKKEIERLATI